MTGPSCLYVSTALGTWCPEQPEMFARDCQIDATCYRRLDPEYFAWLRSRMALANAAAVGGRIPVAAFNEARAKFNAIQEWAIEHLGEPELLEAMRRLRPDTYVPPVAEPLSQATSSAEVIPEPRLPAGVDPDAVAMVDAIREQAISLGWKHAALYRVPDNHRAAWRADCGLVCHLRQGWRIGEVTRQSIELVGPPPLEVRQHFYNPDVEQPWIIPARK